MFPVSAVYFWLCRGMKKWLEGKCQKLQFLWWPHEADFKVSESLDSHIEIPNFTVLKLVFTPWQFGLYESFWPSSKVWWSAGKLEVGPVWLITNHPRSLCFSVGNWNSSILSDCFLALIYKHVYLCGPPIQLLVTKFSPQWWASVCLGFQSSWSW